jgi:hypothetical protein
MVQEFNEPFDWKICENSIWRFIVNENPAHLFAALVRGVGIAVVYGDLSGVYLLLLGARPNPTTNEGFTESIAETISPSIFE